MGACIWGTDGKWGPKQKLPQCLRPVPGAESRERRSQPDRAVLQAPLVMLHCSGRSHKSSSTGFCFRAGEKPTASLAKAAETSAFPDCIQRQVIFFPLKTKPF